MNFVYCIDDDYSFYAAVSIRSLCKTLSGEDTVWMVSRGELTTSSQDILRKAVRGYLTEVRFVALSDVPDSVGRSTMRTVQRVSEAMYLRFHLGDVIPHDDATALYIDADTLFVSTGIEDLEQVQLGSALVGAVRDVGCRRLSDFGGLPGLERVPSRWIDSMYFNSGLLLFDPSVWHDADVMGRCYDYLDSVPARRFPDQDALNFVCAGRWLRLNKRYNHLMGSRLDNVVRRDLSAAVMVHAAGPWKFWDDTFPDGARRDLYRSLASELVDDV